MIRLLWVLLHVPTLSLAFELTTFTEIPATIPVGNDGRSSTMNIYVPVKPGTSQITTPSKLYQHVKQVWDAVIEDNQAGLMDAKQLSTNQPPFSPAEAWHHYKAGQQGIIDSARFLLAFSVIPSLQSGGSLLHTFASHNNVKQIELLLNDPMVNVDETKFDGTTALFNAVSLGHVEVTQTLLKHQANPNHVSNNGISPIHIASAFGHHPIVRLLIDYNANVNYPQAFAHTTALHFAAEMGRADVIKLLCQRGANQHARKKTGGTALHTASDTNQTSAVVALLAACKADPNLLLNGDTTPLYLAAQRGYSSVVRALVEHGADLNFVMPKGRFHGSLMATGAKQPAPYKAKNTEIGNGATALHAAVENGHLETTVLMLKLGAAQLTSMEGASPLLISLQYKHPKIARALLRGKNHQHILRNSHVNVQTPQDGVFPLFVAVGHGYVNVVKRLLNMGANFSLLTSRNVSALDYAKYKRHKKMIALLEKWGD